MPISSHFFVGVFPALCVRFVLFCFVCFFCNSRFSVIAYSAIGEPFYCYKHPRLLPCTPHARFCKISVVFGSLLAPAFRINLYLNRSRARKTLQLELEPIWLHEVSLNNPQRLVSCWSSPTSRRSQPLLNGAFFAALKYVVSFPISMCQKFRSSSIDGGRYEVYRSYVIH